jgi:WD40 repeat protein
MKDGKPLSRIGGAVDWRFSNAGDLLAATTYQSTVQLYSSSTGQELFTLAGHTLPVTGMWFSANGDELATAASDGTVRIWRLTT